MDKEREIEKMARKICKSSSVGCNFPTCAKCGIKETCKERVYATRSINEGYGDTKQAVREFAAGLEEIRHSVRGLNVCFDDEWRYLLEDVLIKIDELLAEVTEE